MNKAIYFSLLILFSCREVDLIAQNINSIDADLVFIEDASAMTFFNSFPDIEEIQNWDSIITYKDTLQYGAYYSYSPAREILFFHGGSFYSGNISQFKKICYYLSRYHNCNCYSGEYSLITNGATLDSIISDVHDLIDIINPDIIGGMSSGGYLAARSVIIDGYDLKLILINPVIDFSESGYTYGYNITFPYWQDYSVSHNLTNDHNSIILHGTNDDHLSKDMYYQFIESSQNSVGYLFNGRKHGFSNYSDEKSGIGHKDFIYTTYFITKWILNNN